MQLPILLLNLVLCLTYAEAGAKTSPRTDLQGLENLVEKLVESRLSDLETRMQRKLELRWQELDMRTKEEKEKQEKEKKGLEANIKEMEKRLEELADKMEEKKDEWEKREARLKASISKLSMKVEEAFNHSNNTVTKPSLRNLPIVSISAGRSEWLSSQTVTFDSFLANFNNANRPGGGDGVHDLDSGVFTCATPGYYAVSFSAYGNLGPDHDQQLYLYKNGKEVPESILRSYADPDALADLIGVTSSRIVVSNLLDTLA